MMDKTSSRRKDIESFNTNIKYLLNLKYTFDYLFVWNKGKEDLFSSAFLFFQELNDVYIRSINLEMAKLLDPSFSFGKSNLTIDYMIENFFDQNDLKELETIISTIKAIKQPLKEVRNKILAHSDLASYRTIVILGAYSDEKLENYFTYLVYFTNALNKNFLNEPFDYSPNNIGDVDDFFKIYKKGLKHH